MLDFFLGHGEKNHKLQCKMCHQGFTPSDNKDAHFKIIFSGAQSESRIANGYNCCPDCIETIERAIVKASEDSKYQKLMDMRNKLRKKLWDCKEEQTQD